MLYCRLGLQRYTFFVGNQQKLVRFFSLFVAKISPFVKKMVWFLEKKSNLQNFIYKIGATERFLVPLWGVRNTAKQATQHKEENDKTKQ